MEYDNDYVGSSLVPRPRDLSALHIATVPSTDILSGLASRTGYIIGTPSYNVFSSAMTPGSSDYRDIQGTSVVDQFSMVLSTQAAVQLTTQIGRDSQDIIRFHTDHGTLTIIDPISQRPVHQGVVAHVSVQARQQDHGRDVPVLAVTHGEEASHHDFLHLRESPHTPSRRVTVLNGEESRKRARFVYESERSEYGDDGILTIVTSDSDVEMGTEDDEDSEELSEEDASESVPEAARTTDPRRSR